MPDRGRAGYLEGKTGSPMVRRAKVATAPREQLGNKGLLSMSCRRTAELENRSPN